METYETVHAEPEWIVFTPIYRVNFWSPPPMPGYSWSLDAHVIRGAVDTLEAIRWAEKVADGRLFELYVEAAEAAPIEAFDVPRSAPLIRLYGRNPNATL